MRYYEIRIEVPSAHREPVSELLCEHALTFQECDQTTLDPPPPGRVRFQLYLSDEEAAEVPELLQAVHELLPTDAAPTVEQRERDDAEWIDTWKRYFTTRRIGRIAIVPSWESDAHAPQPDEITLHLDPGRAFGTGGHATTRLCLQLIDGLQARPEAAAVVAALAQPGSEAARESQGVTILDVGCGCGVLAIAALRLYPSARARGIDIDPEAAEVTRENAERNEVAARLLADTTPLEEVPGRYPLILCNLTGPTLHELAAELGARLAPGGLLVLSGILTAEAPEVLARFTAQGLAVRAEEREDEWTGALLQRPA
jgi:ribosomal protein L11 methyltransferase